VVTTICGVRDRCFNSDEQREMGWPASKKMNGEQVESLLLVCQHEFGFDISER
jgi:transposase